MDFLETNEVANLGEQAHINPNSPNGPRGAEALKPHEQPIDKSGLATYDNIILLCRNCHKQVDEATEYFNAERLKEEKALHEKWVGECLGIAQRASEPHKQLCQLWLDTLDPVIWRHGMNSLLTRAWQPLMSKQLVDVIEEMSERSRRQTWELLPPRIRHAIQWCSDALSGLAQFSSREMSPSRRFDNYFEMHVPPSPPKQRRMTLAAGERELQKHLTKLAIVRNFGVECTKAANLVICAIRSELDATFAYEQGLLVLDNCFSRPPLFEAAESEPIQTGAQRFDAETFEQGGWEKRATHIPLDEDFDPEDYHQFGWNL